MTVAPRFTLSSGRKIPCIAFGTGTSYFERNDDVCDGILKAFDAGFRYIDTAIMYQTEAGVGKAVKRLINEKGFKREDFFVATKINSHEHTYEKAMAAMKQSFERLGMDYVDLVLIHSPGMPQDYKGDFSKFLSDEEIKKLPKTPEELKEGTFFFNGELVLEYFDFIYNFRMCSMPIFKPLHIT